jgi:hypothetical protein
MSKSNTIDADYLGVCMCLNPPGMLYMLVDIISLSFTHLTFKQPDTWKHLAFITKIPLIFVAPFGCGCHLLGLKIQNPRVWSSDFRREELNVFFLLFRVSAVP